MKNKPKESKNKKTLIIVLFEGREGREERGYFVVEVEVFSSRSSSLSHSLPVSRLLSLSPSNEACALSKIETNTIHLCLQNREEGKRKKEKGRG